MFEDKETAHTLLAHPSHLTSSVDMRTGYLRPSLSVPEHLMVIKKGLWYELPRPTVCPWGGSQGVYEAGHQS